MRAGQITAKLRDAVPVRFMENGAELKRYKNIDIPDSLKELEIQDFQFDVATDGKITFQLFFEAGILPDIFPENRVKMTRAEKAAAKAAAEKEETPEPPESTVIVNIAAAISADEDKQTESGNMKIEYNVKGDHRKALVTAIGEIIGEKPTYKGAPSYAFVIGNYLVDRYGTLTGENNQELIDALTAEGFTAE